MDVGPLFKDLIEQIDRMPAQLQVAARFVLDRPNDVALLSMREQAKRAGVPPATMTRLAQRLGFAGYEDVRSIYAESVRRGTDGFSDRVQTLVDSHRAKGETAVAVDVIETVTAQMDALRAVNVLDGLLRASALMLEAKRLCIIGQRSSYPVAFQLAYLCGLIGCETRLLDGPGAIGIDHLHDADAGDVLVVISIRPYSTESLKTARYAAQRGVKVIAVTDSRRSPFAGVAAHVIVAGVESPSFFHTMVPTLMVIEALAALLAAAKGESASKALAARELHFEATDALLMLRPPPKAD